MLAKNPVRALGAFHAHDKTLHSYLPPAPSPLESLQRFTHSTETDIDGAEAIAASRRIKNREISSKHRENGLDLGNPDGAMRVRMHKQSDSRDSRVATRDEIKIEIGFG